MVIQKADPFGENNHIKLIVNNNISNRNIERVSIDFLWLTFILAAQNAPMELFSLTTELKAPDIYKIFINP